MCSFVNNKKNQCRLIQSTLKTKWKSPPYKVIDVKNFFGKLKLIYILQISFQGGEKPKLQINTPILFCFMSSFYKF
jgi:hypothetical protein